MSQSVLIRLDLPDELRTFRFPASLDQRLQFLLDRQDDGYELTAEERAEAEALVDVANVLSVLKGSFELAARAAA